MKSPVFLRKTPIIKGMFSILIGVLFQVFFVFTKSFDTQLALIFAVFFAFSAPYMLNIYLLKRYIYPSLKPFIINDLLFHLLPAIFVSSVSEFIFVSLSGAPRFTAGMGSIIFIAVAIILNLFFWLYYVLSKVLYK